MAVKKQRLNKKVKIKDIVFDKELYPRENYSWQKALEYSDGMKLRSKFPRIALALNNNKLYLLDGKHRIEACKLLKITEIDAEIYTGLSRSEMFKLAIKANTAHGLGLSAFDKRRCAIRLIEMGLGNKEVSNLVQVAEDKLETFVQQRMVNTLTGKEVDVDNDKDFYQGLGQQVLKSSVKQFAGLSGTDAQYIVRAQKGLLGNNQYQIWKSVVHLLENDLIDTTDPQTVKMFSKARTLMRKYKF